MSETTKSFSLEQIKAFEDKYNLGVSNHEAMVELLMRQQEQIDEIGKNIKLDNHPQFDTYMVNEPKTLFDKWNK
jgi:hypothetical protein